MINGKMIEVTIRFFANDIKLNDDGEIEYGGKDSGSFVPKYAWINGSVAMPKNDLHGISGSEKTEIFNSLMEIPTAIEKVLKQNGIKLVIARAMRKYLVSCKD